MAGVFLRSEPWAEGREVQRIECLTVWEPPQERRTRTRLAPGQAGITASALFYKRCVGESRLEPAESLGFAVCGLPSFGREGRLEGADARCSQEFARFQHPPLGDALKG